jgi:8-oxo-dGTP pyrophosphatase MutT (NUDIX family)
MLCTHRDDAVGRTDRHGGPIMSIDSSRVIAGELARSLVTGYYAHVAALRLVRDPGSTPWAPPTSHADEPLTGVARRHDGTLLTFDWQVNLHIARTDPALSAQLDRAWATSALVVLGDRLQADGYFDRAPILEMVRQLRNGVAHGNRFTITAPEELASRPAHTRDAACRSPLGSTFEITPADDGRTVLFDFLGPGDIIDILASVGTHLLGEGAHHLPRHPRTADGSADSAAFRSLPRKRIGAGIVIVDDRDRVLLVQPTYKDSWEIPGGLVELGESPRQAAAREVREELGLDVQVGRLLVIDWVPRGRYPDDGVMLLFAGGRVEESRIRLPGDELRDWEWCDRATVRERVVDVLAHRIGAALRAISSGDTVELENGMPVTP